jgi:putative transposase
MGDTYTQVHLHVIFAVKFREALIKPNIKGRVHSYITAIIQNRGHKMLCINSMPNHVHMLFALRPNESISDLMREVKGNSSEWINQSRLCPSKFRWQEGYAAFAVEKQNISRVATYIENQEQHHRKVTFREEYISMLNDLEIPYDERYLFTDPE